ncbi:hypothetical protein NKG94_49795 [Micromonospora sp. M12]
MIERLGDEEFEAHAGQDDPRDHDQVGERHVGRESGGVRGAVDGGIQHPSRYVEVDPPEQDRRRQCQQEATGLGGVELAAAERQPDDEDRLTDRDEEELLVPLGQVFGGDHLAADPLRADAGSASRGTARCSRSARRRSRASRGACPCWPGHR